MPNLSADPFYIVKQEIQDTVNDLQQQMSRFHGLTANNPERKTIAQAVEQGCNSVKWQLKELEGAINKACENPAKFNLTLDELNSRRKWITNTRRQIDGMVQSLHTATASPALALAQSKAASANDAFLSGQSEQQQLMLKQQDAQLDDIEQAVTRLGRVGKTIHEELASQGALLDELDEDVDTTHTRLRAAQKKVLDVIKKSGSTTQLALIVFLVVVLIVLAVLAFM